jgi:peroxiredoxin
MLKRWLTVGGILSVIIILGWFALPEPSGRVVEGDVAPAFSLPDMDGVEQALPKGKVVLLNFWATWCPPCREEMPSMIKLHKQLQEQGLVVMAASIDKDVDKLSTFIREYSIPFQVLQDTDKSVSRQLYGVIRVPESFLIDREGKVRFHLIGAVNWTDPTVLQAINTMLAEKTPD